jgi:signal transduction histidine kinase/CheY-like chemotaxis protein
MSWWLLPSAVAVVILAGLCVFLFVRRPPAPLWPVALLCQVAALIWVSGDLLTYFAATVTQKQLALSLLFTGSLSLPALWWATSIRYVRSHHLPWPWIHSRWVMLPTLVGALGWLAMITNPWHGLFVTPIVGGRSEYHALSTPFIVANIGMILGASVHFIGLSAQPLSQDVRRSAQILAFSALAPLIASMVYFFSDWDIPIDPVCIGLSVACGAMVWGIYHTGLFTLLPVALPELFRHDPNGVLLIGPGGRLLHWNPAAQRILDGVRLAPELDFFSLLLPELREASGEAALASNPVELALRLCKEPQDSQGHVYRLGDSDRWVRVSAAPVPSRRGHLAAISVRIEDVTPLQQLERERQELEARVRHADKLKSLGLLAGSIAHDFNNLLGSIRGNASLAIQGRLPEPALREHLLEIEDAAQQASELTLQLMTYGGNAPSHPSRVELSELVTEMVRLLDVSVSGRATLQTHFDPEPTAVDADPAHLRQLVMNLITNAAEAVEASGRDGIVALHTRRVDVTESFAPHLSGGAIEPGRHVVLEVVDTGTGMSDEVRDQIFDPFFSTRRDGRGLGMAVVFGCVQALHGGIEIESHPGAGTTLRVYLPESQHSAAPSSDRAADPDTSPAALARGDGCALVVDDEPRMLRVLAATLRHAGFDVITAGSGADGIDRFRESAETIRFVLLDLSMPEVSGEEVLREIRRIDPDTRVILTSGFAESHVMSRLESSKLSGFLQKPYDAAELLAMVHQVLEAPDSSETN